MTDKIVLTDPGRYRLEAFSLEKIVTLSVFSPDNNHAPEGYVDLAEGQVTTLRDFLTAWLLSGPEEKVELSLTPLQASVLRDVLERIPEERK